MKSVGYREGRLVDYRDTLDKLQHVLNRPKAKAARAPFHLTPRQTLLRRELPLSDDDFRSTSSCTETSESEDVASLPPRSASADRSRTLQLPPIQAGRRQSQYERSLPGYRRERDTELPSLVRRVSSFGPY